ncbi:hypothetical protein Rsub_04255 [Raphidocelis subcapitata]|uniref:2Fe-2S ferredoxin-type domain-containing protein n=1 Tax=Raphidocelis subcapitata TaxID=307507 RepID=A0A2V0P367_9CHLO|nr:hypothetical protein Rsub_04255 [Raphidocelis subcapitata]|eukprot:GBF91515.1 hypothetical protein Rsub_04255 [Raphidocelis subcapitata]
MLNAGGAHRRACGSGGGARRGSRGSTAVAAPAAGAVRRAFCSGRRRPQGAIAAGGRDGSAGNAIEAGAPGSSGASANSGSSNSSSTGRSGAPRPPLAVYFKAEDVLTQAAPGDVIMEVAERCGITIPGGCYSGNCGICEVEVRKFAAGAAAGAPRPPAAVVRACVARLPPGYERVEIEALPDDQLWGLDGFDT